MSSVLRPSYWVRTGSMYENPYGTPRDEIDRMVRELPPEVVAQAVFGKFVEASGLVFTAELINELFDRSIPTINAQEWYDRERTKQLRIEQAERFDPYRCAVGVDLARKTDYTVIFAIDTKERPARVVYFKRLNRVPWEQIYAEIGRAQWLYSAELLIDGTGTGGDVVYDELQSRLYCPQHHEAFTARGSCPQRGRPVGTMGGECIKHWRRIDPQSFIFSATSKVNLVNHLQNVMGHGYAPNEPGKPFGLLRCPPILSLQDELTEYAWDDKKLQTDCVFALALAAWQGIQGIVDDVSVGSVFAW